MHRQVTGPPSSDAVAADSGRVLISLAASPNTPTARAMFFTACSPRSAKAIDSLARTWSFAALEIHTPPGGHGDPTPPREAAPPVVRAGASRSDRTIAVHTG